MIYWLCEELSGVLANAALACSVVDGQEYVSDAVHEDMLYNQLTRFDHQSYDAIEALAVKPSSGFKLTDRERPNHITCTEGKQTNTDSRRRIVESIRRLTGAVESSVI